MEANAQRTMHEADTHPRKDNFFIFND
jgi:hypothetical protein